MATMTFERHDERALPRLDVDAAIVMAAQRDLRAFAPLYEKYFDSVYGYCLRSLRDSEAAADAASQTFAKAMKALPKYKAWSFRSWLFSIAHNVIVDSLVEMRKDLGVFQDAILAAKAAIIDADEQAQADLQVAVLRTQGLDLGSPEPEPPTPGVPTGTDTDTDGGDV